jgi:hypothetical protein
MKWLKPSNDGTHICPYCHQPVVAGDEHGILRAAYDNLDTPAELVCRVKMIVIYPQYLGTMESN